MNLQTDRQIKVWARDGQYGRMFSIGISEKQQDGTYRTSYIPVSFRGEVNIDNGDMIYIRNAWLKPTKDNGIKIFINEFEHVEDVAKEALHSDDTFNPNEITLAEDDYPF